MQLTRLRGLRLYPTLFGGDKMLLIRMQLTRLRGLRLYPTLFGGDKMLLIRMQLTRLRGLRPAGRIGEIIILLH